MGDRSNIYIQDWQEGQGVYIYSHWGGTNHLANGLAALQHPFAQARWSDPSYLTRIIVQQILDDAGFDETGFGISATMPDNSYPILVLDTENQTVALVEEGQEKERQPNGVPFAEAGNFPLERTLKIAEKVS